MEPVDFAVRIEEVMAEECTSYECIFEDEDELARIWKFLFEDTLDGYIAFDDNEETFGVQTVSIGLYLKDITEFSREELLTLFSANAEFINAGLSVVKVPVPIEAESLDEGNEESDEEDEEAQPRVTLRDILIIQSRIPFDAFEPEDFRSYVENMLFQYQIILESENEEDELYEEEEGLLLDDEDEDDFEEL
ncbi:MAG: hypothetical protein PWR01_2570 [Clostridiales bacterium]|nr:hypothetical protein [Clostridiales bacterium]MDN5281497.1 hypothetical protein [Candidatus Ozemobacter sp.]